MKTSVRNRFSGYQDRVIRKQKSCGNKGLNVIIGGGSTGIAALNLSRNKSALFEASSKLGGILKDHYLGEDKVFFKSCQYLDANATWLDGANRFNAGLYKFRHLYGSYTDLFGESTFSSDFAGPIFNKKIEPFTQQLSDLASISDRIELYGEQISEPLKIWFKNLGVDVTTTHHSGIEGFQCSRISTQKNMEALNALKSTNNVVDLLWGLPRSYLKLEDLYSYLPSNGYSALFNKGNMSGVNLDAIIKPVFDNGKIYLYSGEKLILYNSVLWTSDPSPLIQQISKHKLDSSRFRTESVFGFLDEPVKNPFYIQTYSLYSLVTRVFVYNINGKGCFTIEKGHDLEGSDQIKLFANELLERFGFPTINEILGRRSEVRFFAYSIADYKFIRNFRTMHGVDNLFLPDFLCYGRESKIRSIPEDFLT